MSIDILHTFVAQEREEPVVDAANVQEQDGAVVDDRGDEWQEREEEEEERRKEEERRVREKKRSQRHRPTGIVGLSSKLLYFENSQLVEEIDDIPAIEIQSFKTRIGKLLKLAFLKVNPFPIRVRVFGPALARTLNPTCARTHARTHEHTLTLYITHTGERGMRVHRC